MCIRDRINGGTPNVTIESFHASAGHLDPPAYISFTSVVFAALNFAILVHYRIVTDIRGHSLPADKQTDGQTHYRIIYCARITSRDKNFKRSQNTFVSVSEVVRAQ